MRAMLRGFAVAAATVLVAAATAVLPTAPAHAALCGGSGVNVIASFGALGGGTQTGCAASGGGSSAWQISVAAGFPLEQPQRQPGFVCRVRGLPTKADEPCVNTPPADAYWGLFWSDGKSATWHYSTLGAAALKVPEGGSVGWAWQDGGARDLPAMAPPVAAKEPAPAPATKPAPKPKPKPKRGPRTPAPAPATQGGSTTGAEPAPSEAAAPTAASDPEPKARADRRKARAGRPKTASTPGATPTDPAAADEPAETDEAAETDEPLAVDDDTALTAGDGPADPGGLPWWVPVGLVVVLGAGAVIAVRRRGVGSSTQ